MRMLLAGGGTGGHFFPAVALAQQLLAAEPESKVLFVGTSRGIEARLTPELGYELELVEISGFVGKGLVGKVSVAAKLVKSVFRSLEILDRFKPDVVVGVGGYASAPVLIAALLKKYPTLIHEQNAWPGMTNRLLARWVDRVCLSFGEAEGAFHKAVTVLTGNPLRSGMEECSDIPAGDPSLLVFGGSLGARAINNALVEALPLLAPLGKVNILHQTGAEDLERIKKGYVEAGWDEDAVVPFITDMPAAYARAQLVLCRAGATTLAELTACGRPAILVPYPHAAADHQSANARALEKKNAAIVLPQSELSAERLAAMILEFLADRPRLLAMAEAARQAGKRGAAELILKQCRAIARKGQ